MTAELSSYWIWDTLFAGLMHFLDINTKAHDVFLPHNMKTQDTCFIDAIDRLIILKKHE